MTINNVEILTTAECGDYLRICQRMLFNLIKDEKIPYFRIGRKICFDKAALNDWMSKGGTNAKN
jgi:excisionase family DNA binding protein